MSVPMLKASSLALLSLTAAGSCGKGATPDRAGATPPSPKEEPPAVLVAWAGTADVSEVLGSDPSALRAVQVPRRHLPAGLTVHPATAFPGYRVATQCGPRYCVDGIVPDDQLTSSDELKSCGVHALRSQVSRATHPSGVCTFLVIAALTSDDREILGSDPASWLERGISLTHVDGDWVSYYEAQADFTAGAAHSNASLRCRSLAALGVDHLDASFDRGQLAAANVAVHAFLDQQRDDDDERALGLTTQLEDIADTRDFLITGPSSFSLCLSTGPDEQELQLVSVRLPARRT